MRCWCMLVVLVASNCDCNLRYWASHMTSPPMQTFTTIHALPDHTVHSMSLFNYISRHRCTHTHTHTHIHTHTHTHTLPFWSVAYLYVEVKWLSPYMGRLFNSCLEHGSLPSSFQSCYVKPLLKKTSLIAANVKTCWLITSLSVKLLQSLVAWQLVNTWSGPPSNTWFPEPTRALNPNGISIRSAVLQDSLVWQTDRLTDRPRYSVGNSRLHRRL